VGLGILGIQIFHLCVVFGIELVLEVVVLLHYIIDHGGDHKAGKVYEALEFVGHYNGIWTTNIVKTILFPHPNVVKVTVFDVNGPKKEAVVDP